jgi:hypothetical protein
MFRSGNCAIVVTIPPLALIFFAPPGAPLPVIGKRSYAFQVEDREVTVIQFCREYLEALKRLVQEFRR